MFSKLREVAEALFFAPFIVHVHEDQKSKLLLSKKLSFS